MKQMHCPHFVRMSGTQYYCMKGNFPVDCYKCDCPDKKEIEMTITTSSSFDCKDCTNRKGCINCENGELREYKPVAKKEAEGNLKRLIDEMKSDVEVADDLGITPSEYRDLVTNALFEEKSKLKDMKELNEIIICACGLPEHQMVFRTIEGDEDVCVVYHLCKLSFWKRLKYGVKYIFGYTSKYGAFDEMIFTKEHIPTLEKVIKWLKIDHNPIR